MASFQPPPTNQLPIEYNKEKPEESTFNENWLKWFVDLVGIINAAGGGAGSFEHNLLNGLQGGSAGGAGERYHLTGMQHTAILAFLSSLPLPTFADGTYLPTLTNTTNIAASTAFDLTYLRLGDSVQVGGIVQIDPTAAGAIALDISLPVGSNFVSSTQAGGAAAAVAVSESGGIVAVGGGTTVRLLATVTDVANRTWAFSFTYRIIP